MTAEILIIGIGSIGKKHIGHLLGMGYRNLVGVDPRPDTGESRIPIVKELRDIDTWPTYRATHALVCSPPGAHFMQAKWCLDRGIRVFIEKPMAMDIHEARTLQAIAHANKQKIAIGYMERAHPRVQEAKAYAYAHGCTRAEIYCYWRATPKTYQFDVLSESSHSIDTAVYLFGPVSSARVNGRSVVRADLLLAHANGCATNIVMDMDAGPRRRISFRKENYTVEYGVKPEEWTACYKNELRAFLDGMPLCTGDEGVHVMEVLEMVR